MKALFVDSVHPSCEVLLQGFGFECIKGYLMTQEQVMNEFFKVEVVVIRSRFKINAEMLRQATVLKCIARAGAGMENIDVQFAEQLGVKCIHAPEGNRDAVAEHVIGMLLMLFNNLRQADAEVRQGVWLREENRGIELKGKKFGIVGYGNMGEALAQKLIGFGVDILIYDKFKKGFGNQFVRECDMQELYQECDIVSLHVPLSKDTEYLVCNEWIGEFQKPIYLVNTARGKCLRTVDLVSALKSGKVLGACLDVLEYEAVSFEKIAYDDLPISFVELARLKNVVLSPHIAGWTHESNYKISAILAEKIITIFR